LCGFAIAFSHYLVRILPYIILSFIIHELHHYIYSLEVTFMLRSVLFLSLIGLLSSCTNPYEYRPNTTPNCDVPNWTALKTQLEQEQTLWKAQNISSYRISLGVSPEPAPSSFFEIWVKSNNVFSATNGLTGEVIPSNSQNTDWVGSIQQEFDDYSKYLGKLISENDTSRCMQITYSSKYHFIESSTSFPRSPQVADGGGSSRFSNFRPLDTAYNQTNKCLADYIPPDWENLERRLKEVKDRWSLQKLAGYRYRLQLLGFRPANDVWVTVKSGVVSDVRDFTTNLALPTAQWSNYSPLDGLLEQVASTLKTRSSCTQANLITPKNQNYPLEWFWSEDSSQLADANGGFRIPQLEGLP
jgi:hypothetical protein